MRRRAVPPPRLQLDELHPGSDVGPHPQLDRPSGGDGSMHAKKTYIFLNAFVETVAGPVSSWNTDEGQHPIMAVRAWDERQHLLGWVPLAGR